MSYREQILREIMSELATLYHSDSIESIRVEVVSGGNKRLLFSDGSRLSVPERVALGVEAKPPTLSVV
jgi:hypothetical protein